MALKKLKIEVTRVEYESLCQALDAYVFLADKCQYGSLARIAGEVTNSIKNQIADQGGFEE